MSEYRKYPVRASAITTNAFVAGTVVDMTPEINQMVLYIDFTIGSLTSMEIKVEFSNNDSAYYQESYQSSVTTGVATIVPKSYTFTATGKYRLPIPVKDRFVKVSTNGTGTVTSSLVAIDLIVDAV